MWSSCYRRSTSCQPKAIRGQAPARSRRPSSRPSASSSWTKWLRAVKRSLSPKTVARSRAAAVPGKIENGFRSQPGQHPNRWRHRGADAGRVVRRRGRLRGRTVLILLDTHILIWQEQGDLRIGSAQVTGSAEVVDTRMDVKERAQTTFTKPLRGCVRNRSCNNC